jgi:hypothetical protein
MRTLLSACKTSLTCCSLCQLKNIGTNLDTAKQSRVHLALHFFKKQTMPKDDFFDALRTAPTSERAFCRFAKSTSWNIDSPLAHQFFLLSIIMVWIRIASLNGMRFLICGSTRTSWRSDTGKFGCSNGFDSRCL